MISMLIWCHVPCLLEAKFYPEKYKTNLIKEREGERLEKKISWEFYFILKSDNWLSYRIFIKT